jgi:hypothetical protein
MDNMSYRNNRPAPSRSEAEPVSHAPAAAPASASTSTRKSSSHASKPPKRRRFLVVGIILIILVALGAGWYFFGRSSTASRIDGSKYQAVTLLDSRSYFGKLTVVNDKYMRLTNVYYLQKKNSATNSDATAQSVEKQNASDYVLTKMGNEIHGPEDEMIISTDQIQYFENLKPQGTVSKAIISSQQKQQ